MSTQEIIEKAKEITKILATVHTCVHNAESVGMMEFAHKEIHRALMIEDELSALIAKLPHIVEEVK